MQTTIHGEIWSNDFSQLNQLIRNYQSCLRFAYCRFCKDNLDFNDVRRISKTKYPCLNSTQVADAVLQGQSVRKLFLIQQEKDTEKKTKIEQKLNSKKLSPFERRKLEQNLKNIKNKLKHSKLIFGGRKAWKELKSGTITKKQWDNIRNSQIYSRGDKGRGNRN